MASPQVSAAIALMYAVDSSMTPSRVESMLIAGELTDDRGASGRDDVFGYGELNIAKAIENVIEDTSSSTTFAYSSAPYLDFSSTTTQLNISLNKVGSSALSVTSLSADSATGLSYNSDASDVNGFGAYTIFIDRTSIPTGEFSNAIYFNLSDGDKVAVRLFYNVGTLRSRANIGKAFIGMYDASDNSLWGSLVADVNGSVSFTANDVPPGDYYILTSTDIDDDNTVCDFGELCEYYPRLSDTEQYFTVSDSNLTGYEIYLYPRVRYGGIEAASVKNNTNKKSDAINALEKSISSGTGLISIGSLSNIPTGNSSNKGDKTFNIN
jgi:serine protease